MKTLLIKLFSTDSLPIVGGAGGALSQLGQTSAIPSIEAFIYTLIIAAFGAMIGYGVKLVLDYIVSRYKRK